MPCNTVQTNTVEIDKIKNHDLFEKALRAEFGNVERETGRNGEIFTFNVNGREVTIDGGRAYSTLSEKSLQEIVGRAKVSFSRETVKFAAKRFGWVIEKSADVNDFYIQKG